MLIGYMRVSSADERQSVDLQRDALIAAGVDERHLHQDRASGARDDRPGLKACLADLRFGDVLVVWKLDRLGRSLSHLIRIVDQLKGRGVALHRTLHVFGSSLGGGSCCGAIVPPPRAAEAPAAVPMAESVKVVMFPLSSRCTSIGTPSFSPTSSKIRLLSIKA
jgi:hypothetical protein